PGRHRAGVRAVDLTEADAVERHPGVVNGRLELTCRFLKHLALGCAVRNHHRRSPPVSSGQWTGTLPREFTVMSRARPGYLTPAAAGRAPARPARTARGSRARRRAR